MIKTTHVRASLSEILALLDEVVAVEGYVPSARELTPRVIPIGEETMTLDPEVPENVRRIVVAEEDGWVTIADHPFAETEWGAVLSEALEAPTFTLEGECDHAFYSSIVVHERGVVAHESRVPEDAVHEPDGRHRIRPSFLASYFPAATSALESGLVVNRLGGEENVAMVASALALPNALLSAYDFTTGEDRASRLYEREDTRRIGTGKLREGLAAMMGDLASRFGIEGGAADLQAMLAGFTKMKIEAGLRGTGSGRYSGFVGSKLRAHASFVLDEATARDLTVRVSGSGLANCEITGIRVVSSRDVSAPGRVATPERDEDGYFVRFADLAMSPEDAEIVVYVTGTLVKEGKGALDIEAAIGGPHPTGGSDQTRRFSDKSENKIEVAPALRVPLVPAWVDAEMLRHREHYIAEYDARAAAVGWLAFDRAWGDVRDVAVRMMSDLLAILLEVERSEPKRESITLGPNAGHDEILVALKRGAEVTIEGSMPMRATLDDDDCVCFSSVQMEGSASAGFRATVLRRGGEYLEFPAPITPESDAWTRILTELERGADVTLSAGPIFRAMSIDVSHQPEGSNHFPDPANADRYTRVTLSWRCPRPTQATSARTLSMFATDLLERAGMIEGNLGGVSLAGGASRSPGSFESAYEQLIDTRMKASAPAWLKTHVRSPGHRVLVTAEAAKKLTATPDVDRKPLAHGVLLSAEGDDLFSAARDAMERAVLPLVGESGDPSE